MRPSHSLATAVSLSALLLTSAATLTSRASAQNMGLSLVNGQGDEHIDVPSTPYAIPTRGITIEAWITYDSTTIATGVNRWPTIARHTDTPNAESFIFRVQAASGANRRLAFAHRVASGLQEVDYSFALGEFAVWTHVAATFDGSTSSLYVNGMLVNSVATTGPILDGGGTLRIGNGDLNTGVGAEVWNGGIDDLRIWPYARTAQEILDTKDISLFGIPNGLTFNLDGNPVDTSQGILGVETAGLAYIPASTLPLDGLSAGNFGLGTTTCSMDRMLASAGSRARAGNLAFELVFAEGPASAPGGVLLSAGQMATPFTFLGVDLYVDLVNLIPVVPSTSTDATGVARLPIALGAATQIGLQVWTQGLFLSPCGTDNLVVSEGLQFTVQ